MSIKTDASIVAEEKRYISKSQKMPYYPISFKYGEGALLYDYSGKKYIDFLASAGSANIGHGNKEIAQAVEEQMDRIANYTKCYFYADTPAELAKKLVEVLPGGPDKKVMYSCTGSAAIDGAIKLVRGFTGRSKIISFIEAYHGSTYGSLSISAISLNMRKKIGPLLPEMYHFNYPICLRCKYGQKENSCCLECLKEVEYAFEHYLPAEEVAAVFFEPIAGDAGLVVPPIKYVKALADLCKSHGILLVVDEIQQGVGRTGKWLASEYFPIEPDIVVMGKSIGGGLPLGLAIGRTEIMDCLDEPAHLFTMAGNTSVCAASLKMVEIIERDGLVERAAKLGEYLKNKLLPLVDKYEIVGEVRGLGLSIGVDLVTDKKTMKPNTTAAIKICNRSIEKGLILIYCGQSTLRIQPPLVITKEQIDKGLEIMEESINEYLEGKIGDEVFELTSGVKF